MSYAGKNRKYADELAKALRDKGVEMFYDSFERAALWGEDLYVYLSDLYRLRAKYCIMFLSEHYARKLWTNHERRALRVEHSKKIKHIACQFVLMRRKYQEFLKLSGM